MNKPEKIRTIELSVQKSAADVAIVMLKRQRARWLLRPIYRTCKWVERKCDTLLRVDGWR